MVLSASIIKAVLFLHQVVSRRHLLSETLKMNMRILFVFAACMCLSSATYLFKGFKGYRGGSSSSDHYGDSSSSDHYGDYSSSDDYGSSSSDWRKHSHSSSDVYNVCRFHADIPYGHLTYSHNYYLNSEMRCLCNPGYKPKYDCWFTCHSDGHWHRHGHSDSSSSSVEDNFICVKVNQYNY